MSRETKIPQHLIESFQPKYLSAFPAFKEWWRYVEAQLRSVHQLTTILGRQRYFFGNARDPDIIRAAVAYEPQSVTADTIDRGILKLWKSNLPIQILLQVHDSVLFQFPEEMEDEIVPKALKMIEQDVQLKGGRTFRIPAEAKVGYNWSDDEDDERALKKWKP
jgi:DNA polymerase-1